RRGSAAGAAGWDRPAGRGAAPWSQRAASTSARSAPAGDGRDDGDLVARLQRGLGALKEAYVFLVHVEVDEAAHLASLVQQALLEPWILLLQILDEVAHGVGGRLHLGLVTGEGAERGRNSHEHGHVASPRVPGSDAGLGFQIGQRLV